MKTLCTIVAFCLFVSTLPLAAGERLAEEQLLFRPAGAAFDSPEYARHLINDGGPAGLRFTGSVPRAKPKRGIFRKIGRTMSRAGNLGMKRNAAEDEDSDDQKAAKKKGGGRAGVIIALVAAGVVVAWIGYELDKEQ